MHKCGVTAGAWAIVHASRKPRVNAANDGYKPVKTVNIINGDVYNMDNVYFLAWCFNGVFGVSYTKFKTIEDLNVWKDKYNVKINAIHEYRNNHLYSVIFEDERAKQERIKRSL